MGLPGISHEHCPVYSNRTWEHSIWLISQRFRVPLCLLLMSCLLVPACLV